MFKQVLNQIRLLRRAQEESELGFEFHYVIMKKTNIACAKQSENVDLVG